MELHGHYIRFELQSPPLLPTIFCQPVSIGGPHGLGLDFPVWPILVPADEGFNLCYTDNENFRDTYLRQGFCGLDSSFKDQFNYNCHKQAVQVAPILREKRLGRQEQINQESVSQDRGSGSSQYNRQEKKRMLQAYFEPFSVFGYFSLPVPRFAMNTLRCVRPYVETMVKSVLTVFGVLCYFSFFATPVVGIIVLMVGAALGVIALLLESSGLVRPGAFDAPKDTRPPLSTAASTDMRRYRQSQAQAQAQARSRRAAETTATTSTTTTTGLRRPFSPGDEDDEEPFELVRRLSGGTSATSAAPAAGDDGGNKNKNNNNDNNNNNGARAFYAESRRRRRNIRILESGYSREWGRDSSSDSDDDTSDRATPPSLGSGSLGETY
ncbi:hypothetical protein C7999DRAFT_10857 [Corynascus novoguineensis]|uniref:Uncharacterized protein n=1 Tax=Corynascus novoguineensis TaxID=1126955 RepID=A0AAN7HIK4_9PEZI|nr:hypothetical protein C7999DRAFT_10857 [Corynascus novoguineensis]